MFLRLFKQGPSRLKRFDPALLTKSNNIKRPVPKQAKKNLSTHKITVNKIYVA